MNKLVYPVIGLLLLASPVRAYDPPAAVRAAIEAASGATGFSGVVLVDTGDGRPWIYATGQAALSPARPNTAETRFDIGSVGKILTATAMMQLVEAGRVSLDAPISTYLPDFPGPAGDRVTVAMLMNHTNGLDEVLFNPAFMARTAGAHDNHDVYAVIADQPNAGAGQGGFAYSNSGLIVAGEIIARVSGQSYEAFLKEHVLDPAGMTGVAFSGAQAGERAFGYLNQPFGGPPPGGLPGPGGPPRGPGGAGAPGGPGPRGPGPGPQALSPTPYDQPFPFAEEQIATAAGGLYARASDLAAFGRAMIGNRLISAAGLARMCPGEQDPGAPRSGLGCATLTGGGVTTFGHNGGRPGMEADLSIAASKGAVVVVLSNHDRRAASVAMSFRAALAALPDR